MTPPASPDAIVLDRVTLREIHLPLVEPFRTASGTVLARRVLLLELATADGASAWSECVAEATPGYSPDTVDTCWLALVEWLAPRVLREAFEDPAALDAALAAGIRGHRMARAALEMGAWALHAEALGQPLATALVAALGPPGGGTGVPASEVPAGIALGMFETPALLAERVQAAAADGYRRIKVKIEPGRDVAWIAAAREAIGPALPLSADANASYTLEDPAHADALARLDAFDLAMLEQPLAWDDLRRHATLQQRLATPICLDESITGRRAAEDMLALRAARIVNLKPGRVGGLTESLAIHDLCHGAGVPLWCGGMLETGIGRAYNVALASLPGFTLPGDLSPSARYWERDVVTEPWTMTRAGTVRVPLDRPGIGVQPDLAFIDALTTRVMTLRAP